MLINTFQSAPEIGKPITLKLSSGEEVIGKVTEFNADYLFLLKPCVIFINPKNGQLVMQNVLLSADHEKPVQFTRSSIVASAAPSKEIGDQYVGALSGIVKAGPGIII
jgi:hypothetical protein